eukprot:COSAG01_NODE_19_length_39011_cov_38.134968_44_plen_82_part_00
MMMCTKCCQYNIYLSSLPPVCHGHSLAWVARPVPRARRDEHGELASVVTPRCQHPSAASLGRAKAQRHWHPQHRHFHSNGP